MSDFFNRIPCIITCCLNTSDIRELSVEMFIEQLEDNYDAAAEEQYYEEYLKEQQAAVQAGADILRQIRNAL